MRGSWLNGKWKDLRYVRRKQRPKHSPKKAWVNSLRLWVLEQGECYLFVSLSLYQFVFFCKCCSSLIAENSCWFKTRDARVLLALLQPLIDTNLWVFSNVVNHGSRKIAVHILLFYIAIALLCWQHFVPICGIFQMLSIAKNSCFSNSAIYSAIALLHWQHFVPICGFFSNVVNPGLRKIAAFPNSAILVWNSPATLTTLCSNLLVFSNVFICGLRKIAAFPKSAILPRHSPGTLTTHLYQFVGFFQCCQPRVAENSYLFKFRFSTVL